MRIFEPPRVPTLTPLHRLCLLRSKNTSHIDHHIKMIVREEVKNLEARVTYLEQKQKIMERSG